MLVVAWRDLQWRRRRFLIAVSGTALVFAMTLVLAGLSNAFVVEVDRTLDVVGADRWIVAQGATSGFNSSQVLPATTLRRVRATPGVVAADPFVAMHGTMGRGDPRNVTMIGAVPGGVGSPSVTDGHAPRRDGEVAVSGRLDASIGDRVVIGGRPFVVVGVVPRSSLYGGTANVFLTLHAVQALTFDGLDLSTAVALRGAPSHAPPGTKIVTNAQSRSDLLAVLGAGRETINVVAVLLWLVAACIVGSIVYLSTLERVRDFAVFKATGTSTRSLMGGLAFQAVLISLLAAVLGSVVATVMAPRFPIPAEIPASAYVLLPIVAIVVGFLASLAGLRRAVTVSPALAFGGA
jgi:putative ABC transport system permease protein